MTQITVSNIPPLPPECEGWLVEQGTPRAGDWFLRLDGKSWENALRNLPNNGFRMVARKPTPAVFDPSKPIETVGGKSVTLITTEGRGEFPLVGYIGDDENLDFWTQEGLHGSLNRPTCDDLRNVPKPKPETQWVNVYEDSPVYKTKEQANANAFFGSIACVQHTWGEGL
jgi:hypothetical protein